MSSQSSVVRTPHPILSHVRQYTVVVHSCKSRITITLPCRSNLSTARRPSIFIFSTKIWYEFLIYLVRALFSAYLVFDFMIVNLVKVQNLMPLIIQLSPASPYFPSVDCPDTASSTSISKPLDLCSSILVTGQVLAKTPNRCRSFRSLTSSITDALKSVRTPPAASL